jgi:hypothetical protein
MKRTILTALAVAAAASAFSQNANHAAAEKMIIANENAINAAFEKNDPAALQKNCLPEAFAVDASGAMAVAEMVKLLPEMKVAPGWKIDSSRFLWIDENTAVHAFRWTGKATAMGQPVPSPAWSSTVWVQRGGQWRAAFHQETAAMNPPSPPPAKK